MITFAVLGLGNRGSVYSNNIVKHDNAKIVSVCDISPASLKQAKELYGVKDEELFSSEEKFFEKKRADVLIVATLDGLHCRQTVKALSLGYDVLLEKPVAPTMKECDEIYAAAKKFGRDVVVCHNLRYTPLHSVLPEAENPYRRRRYRRSIKRGAGGKRCLQPLYVQFYPRQMA